MQTLAARYSAPSLAEQNITRHVLVKQLEHAPRRCILYIHAPAGYGKTTLAAQWLSITKKSAAWMTLDEYSNSPSDIYKGILLLLSCAMENDNSSVNVSLEYMLNAISAHKEWPQAIVIDDFHLCSDYTVSKALPLIRARIPQGVAFVVISRNPPHDLLSDQIIKGAIKQITGLQFANYEITELFKVNNVSISTQYAEVLRQQTDGWAAALSAILMANNDKPYQALLDQNTLNHYLKSSIFEFRDDFDLLKKCSVSDVLNPSLCVRLTGQVGAWKVIEAIAQKTGLVTRLSDTSYRFHALLREFLQSEMESDKNLRKTELYINAASWFMENGDRYRALHLAAKAGDILKMEEMTRDTCREYGNDHMDMDAYTRYVEEHLLPIPKHISSQYPRISIQCSHSALNCRPIEEVFYWLDVLERHMDERRYHPSDYLPAAFVLSVDPRKSSWNVPRQFEKLRALMAAQEHGSPRIFSLAHNLPFFHKAQRDYADIASELPLFSAEIEKQMRPFLGPLFTPLALLLEAGIYYETSELERAEQKAAIAVRFSKNCPPEIRFCAFALFYEVLRLKGKPIDLNHIGTMIAQTKASYLLENFNSYETDVLLYNSSKSAAAKWLSQYEADDNFRLYRIPGYFTSARAMIVLNLYSDAISLLERLIGFSRDFRRNVDYVEAIAMLSICFWNSARHEEAVATLSAAIQKAMEFQLTTPISKNGNDILPVLKRILNRLKHGYDADTLDKAFVNKLFLQAKSISQHVRGMLSETEPTVIKLSPRQKEMLHYLTQNLTYQEISEKTGVKITTVRDHITKLYEKLGVTSAMDAVIKAEELIQ